MFRGKSVYNVLEKDTKSKVFEGKGIHMKRERILDEHGAGEAETNTIYDIQVNIMDGNIP